MELGWTAGEEEYEQNGGFVPTFSKGGQLMVNPCAMIFLVPKACMMHQKH